MFFPRFLLALSLVSPFASLDTFAQDTPRQQTQSETKAISALPESGIPATILQGVPVTRWEKDKVYVFEFWATWCGPCLAAIPHLESMHRQITKENLPAQLIGVNIRDRVTPEKLKKFLERQNTVPSYTIAVDTDGRTDTQWIKPMKVIGIPFSVAVKNGKIIWRGHPLRLSADFIREMTQPEFVAHTTSKSPKQRAEEADKRVREISKLFNRGQIEEAEQALNRLLSDSSIPVAQKLSALEEPCLAALRTEEFRQMNALLRRKAEAFPQSFQNLLGVANFIMTTDDIPAEERDFALALECLQKAEALCSDMPGQRSFLQTRIGEIYDARGNVEDARTAHHNAWELSPEFAYLSKLRKKISESPESKNLLALFDELASGKIIVPKDFYCTEFSSAETKSVVGNTVITASSTQASKDFLAFFDSLEWVQGEAPKSIPANSVLFIDLWTPPRPGPRSKVYSRRPAEWLDEKLSGIDNVKTIVISIERTPGRTSKTLSFPRNRTEHAVAVFPEKAIDTTFFKRFKLTEIPGSVAIRDGQILWTGPAQNLPEWVVREATLPDYDHSASDKRRDSEKKHFAQTAKALNIARTLANKAQFAEALKQLEKIREDLEKHPALDMLASEILSNEAASRGDFEEVSRCSENILKKYPDLSYIAEHQLKVLGATQDLRVATLPTSILACKRIIAGGTPYKSDYWGIIARSYEEMGDLKNAVYAAFCARDSSWKYRKTLEY